jgi:hypothetical protein
VSDACSPAATWSPPTTPPRRTRSPKPRPAWPDAPRVRARCPRLSPLWRPAARDRHRPGPPRRPGHPCPPSPLWGPRAARPCPTRLGRNLVDSPLDQALEASLSPPCTRALTASPRRRRSSGGQRARLTPTLAFAPSTSPFRAHRRGSRGRPDCLDAGRPRGGGLNRPEVALVVPMRPFQARRRGSRGRPDGPDAGRSRGGGVRSYALAVDGHCVPPSPTRCSCGRRRRR